MRLTSSAATWCGTRFPTIASLCQRSKCGLGFRGQSTAVSGSDSGSRQASDLFTPTRTAEGAVKPFYITTPIFYVNASPHVGHLHSLVLSDVIARYSRLRYPDRPVIFSTGTDEHGMKIQQAAKAAGVEEQAFCDQVSERFRDLAAKAKISHTTFIRTSSPEHHRAVEDFWARLVASGDIYKGTHSGWYSVSDECFYGNSQVEKREADGKTYATETGNEVVWEEEENWKFRLSAYKERLTEWAGRNAAVQPSVYQTDVVRQLPTVEDLSISRPATRVKWGVAVPSDPEQTIYVWVDALINYLTVLGYPGGDGLAGWPADVHLVGKDIIRFHAIHWPALLMSAKLPPPHHVVAHAHWTMSKSKMSKSRGNVVDPIASMDHWGVDAVRWYLMRAGGGLPVDADYSTGKLEEYYRMLADRIGNLLSRILSPALLAKMTPWDETAHRDAELDRLLSKLRHTYQGQMGRIDVSHACEGIMRVVNAANRLITREQPWHQTVPSSTKSLVYTYHTLRLAGILLQPVIPDKAAEMLDRLGVGADERSWEHATWPVDIDVELVVSRLKLASYENGWKMLFPKVVQLPRITNAAAATARVKAKAASKSKSPTSI